MSVLVLFLLLTTQQVVVVVQASCITTGNINLCEVGLPKNSTSYVSMTVRSGITETQCLEMMATFEWTEGVFCEKSRFCGLGLDYSQNYLDQLSRDLQPVAEVCRLLIRKDWITCDEIFVKLRTSGIIPSNPHTCIGGGQDYCLGSLQICEDLEGIGFHCLDPQFELSDWVAGECSCWCGQGVRSLQRQCLGIANGIVGLIYSTNQANPCDTIEIPTTEPCITQPCVINTLTTITADVEHAESDGMFKFEALTLEGQTCSLGWFPGGSDHGSTDTHEEVNIVCDVCISQGSDDFHQVQVTMDPDSGNGWQVPTIYLEVNGIETEYQWANTDSIWLDTDRERNFASNANFEKA